MPNGPISPTQGFAMTNAYISYMQGLGVDMNIQTHSVSFVPGDLFSWMTSVKLFTDEFRICYGRYPDGADAGRLSVIIWPYKNGKPAEQPSEEGKDGGTKLVSPFNTGSLNP